MPTNNNQTPVRVLQMTGSLGFAGIETVIMNFYRNIDREKIQFDFVVCEKSGRFDAEVESLGGKIYRLPSRSRHPLAYHNQLRKLLKENKQYQIFQCNANSASAFVDLLAAKRAKVKNCILYSHNASCMMKWQHYIFKPWLGMIKKTKIACSKLAGKWMFGSDKNVIVLNNAVDLNKFGYSATVRESTRQQLGVNDKTIIGHIGSFQDRKNQRFLIDMMSHIADANVQLWLIGEGERKAELVEYANSLNLSDRIKFFGLVDNVHELIQAMDVFAFPSLFEGLPISCIEAAASGLLAVVSDQVSSEVVVTNKTIQLPIVNAADWARYIEHNMRYVRQSVNQQIIDKKYDITAQTRILEKLYSDLTNDAK